ncbi:hypothetical protein CVV68_14895 [Arthrobacter livingstonensis]|uniref:Uncharacterized protein n=1 Tax=Arthrobacter livingstonensis TaxID=670078 RepID=A0A2V5L4R2_9MICC|nr:hypothetical protein CVV68_14895 [Arthrobacter livingstonensis]
MVVVGFFMGGVVGAGTAAFALGVGPLTQVTLKWLHVDLHGSSAKSRLVDVRTPAPVQPAEGALCSGEGDHPLR